MYPISAQYEQFLRKRSRTWLLKADIDGTEYGSSSIISFDIENSLVSGNEFEIGTAIVSKLILKMKTQTEFPVNARIVPYVALSIEDMTWIEAEATWAEADFPWAGGETEWLPLGEFYIDSREKINNSWIFTCYDKLMNANVPYISELTYPATMQDVWDEICTSLEYESASSVKIDPSYSIEVGPTGFTKRQMLGYIASANAASTFMGRDGKIEFRLYSATEEPVYDVGPSDYIRAMQTNPIKTYTRVVVTYDTDDELTYEAGTGDENHTLYIENPFATQEMTDDILAALNGFSYIPIMMDARGYPQIEAGDRIRFSRDESIAWIDANTAWQDMELPWSGIAYFQTLALHAVYSFKGGLKMAIDAPSKSEQQSEFKVDGTLTTAVNRLNQTAVKQGKNYFGVTITREEGLIVERDDHASKAIFNSDELTFYKGSEKALWFDIPSDTYKFSGVIEASSFVGGSIEIGDNFSVNSSGHMIAVGAEFSGEITASTIIGGLIIGTTITGALIQTDTSYPRLEMSSSLNQFGAFVDANNWIKMFANSSGTPLIQLSASSGALTGAIGLDAPNNRLRIISNRDIDLLPGIGNITIPSWSTLRNDSSGQTLQTVLNGKANVFSGFTGTVYVSATSGGSPTVAKTFNNGICTS